MSLSPKTDRQSEIYGFIVWYYRENHNTPSIATLAKKFKIYRGAIERHLGSLNMQGFIEYTGNTRTEYRLPLLRANHASIDT